MIREDLGLFPLLDLCVYVFCLFLLFLCGGAVMRWGQSKKDPFSLAQYF